MKKKEAIVLALLLAFSCKAERSVAPPSEAATETAARAQDGAAPKAPAAPAIPRMVIRNAQMTLVVSDAAPIVARLTALASSVGGYASEEKQWRDDGQLRASITLRIPAQKLDETMATARKLAVRVESENVEANDVTQEYVDLDAQVRNLEATENEMRQLMTDVRQRMKKAEDILEVYQHLTELRGEIEQAKGRMRYLSQLSALATIKVDLIPDAIAKPVVAPGWEPFAVVKDASRVLVRTLQALATMAIWFVIYLLPIALLFALVVWILVRIARAMRTRKSGPSVS